jgi:hypothetical protein
MHDEIRINRFRNLYDNAVKAEGDASWADLVALFSEHLVHDSRDRVPLFNLVRYEDVEVLKQQKRDFGVDDETLDFVPLRRLPNVMQVDALVLDYDGELPIAAAKERFKDYEYLGYTSYNHLKQKTVEKFRLIFPLAAPIPTRFSANGSAKRPDLLTYDQLTDALLKFSGPCDPVATNPNQHYYFPATHPDRKNVAGTWHNKGQILDWRKWESNKPDTGTIDTKFVYTGQYPSKGQKNYLDPNQEFIFQGGTIKAKDVTKRISKVVCPFHHDDKGGEFLNRFDESGVICFRCKHCGTFVLPPTRNQQEVVGKEKSEPATAEPQTTQFNSNDLEKLFGFDFFYEGGPSRDKTVEQLQKIKQEICNDDGHADRLHGLDSLEHLHFVGYKSHLLVMPEGAGKSMLALDFVLSDPRRVRQYPGGPLVKRPYRVIFACRSWQQVFEKFQQFSPALEQRGLYAQIAYSLEGGLQRRFGVRAVRKPAQPFKTGKFLKKETLQRVYEAVGLTGSGKPKYTEEFVKLAWAFIEDPDGEARFQQLCGYDDEPVFDRDIEEVVGTGDNLSDSDQSAGPSMVFTTFARLRLVLARYDSVPRDWIVWFDDPDLDDVIDISPIKPGDLNNKADDQQDSHIQIINGTRYYIRDEGVRLGSALQKHRCIYTTTESLVQTFLEKLLNERKEQYLVHNLMESVHGGRITILGTQAVQRRYDALIPLVVQRIQKERGKKGKPLLLVAEGLGTEFNHSNVKGRNDLSNVDLVIELSKPHQAQIRTVNDALDYDFAKKGHDVTKQMMLDRLHQAIGRNSGYRTREAECVVLVDSMYHQYLVDNCRYLGLDKRNSVLIDRTLKMKRNETRLREDASTLTIAIESLLNNPYPYLLDQRKVRSDIDHVVKTIKTAEKRFSYVARLLYALNALGDVRFDGIQPEPNNPTSKKLSELGHWMLDTFVPKSKRDLVLREYSAYFVD